MDVRVPAHERDAGHRHVGVARQQAFRQIDLLGHDVGLHAESGFLLECSRQMLFRDEMLVGEIGQREIVAEMIGDVLLNGENRHFATAILVANLRGDEQQTILDTVGEDDIVISLNQMILLFEFQYRPFQVGQDELDQSGIAVIGEKGVMNLVDKLHDGEVVTL